jgi:RND family efflux transporter MFP subunit
MRKPSRIVIVLILIILVGTVAARLLRSNNPKDTRRQTSPNVLVETPQIESVQQTLNFTGDVLPVSQVGIFAKVGGSLENVLVQVGDWVHSGQLLAQIDTTELYQAVIQSAATFQNARVTLERDSGLAAKNLISKQEFDNALATMQVARATFESAKLRLGYASIQAPFSGIITKRNLDPGALVNANNAVLFTLMDFDTVKVMVEVLEKDVPKVKKGVEAKIAVDAYPGETFSGVLKRLAESVDLDTRTMVVEVDALNRDHRLKPGMFATVTIILDTHPEALTIPSTTILKDEGGYYVWSISHGVSTKRRIEVGTEQKNRTEVTSGIALSDSIATVGIQLLREGGKVNVSSR